MTILSNKLTRAPIGQDVYFSSVADPKFKHNRISVNFVMPLARETASDNAVVPFILRKGCRSCPDFTSLNARLAELYGAELDVDVTKFGGWQVVELSLKGLDNRFALDGEDVTEKCAELIADIALDPKLQDGLFDRTDVELEKQYLIDTIEAEINEKRTYALARCLQVMCEGEPVAVRRYGDRESAQAVTRRSAAGAYKRIVEGGRVEVLFIGSGNHERAKRLFEKRFADMRRSPLQLPALQIRTAAGKAGEEVERMELSQSKLVMGMRTGSAATVREINARRVFSALFGGTPFSKLFLNVREKLSLCYYCASRYDVTTGLLFVDSGVEAENKQKAQEEVMVQLKAVQDGGFTPEELANTKLLMKNSVISSGDSLTGLEGWYLSQILRGQDYSPMQDCEMLEQITREEVVEAARAVTLDTVYFLTGTEGQA